MSVMKSSLSTGTPEFQANQAAYAARIADLHARRAAALAAGPLPAQEKLRQAKQLLARERVAALLDAGSPFLELCQLGGEGLYPGQAPGAAIVTGVGVVAGRLAW